MKDLSKSSFIFDLIDEFKIFNSSGVSNILTDENFNLFCEKYKQLSKKRDFALFNYLNDNPNIFRSHLPSSRWDIAVAFDVVWYYDELIISDPIMQLINYDIETTENKKHYLQEMLSLLSKVKESIDNGYILFSGNDLTPGKTGQFEIDSKKLVDIPEVLNAFEQISMMIKKYSPINENALDNLIQIEIMYEGLWGKTRKMGMYIPPHVLNTDKLSEGIVFNFTSPYQKLTKEELISFNKTDMLDSLKNEYSKDISVVLETITNAQRLNSSVLFYRDADRAAARSYTSLFGKGQSNLFTDTTVYDCLVPYIGGIPAERLFDVKNQMPEAFKDFRAFLFELVKRTMKNTDNPAELNFKIDSEINKLTRTLKTEMKNAKRKCVFMGITAPLIMMAGSLTLFSSGLDYQQLLSTLLGSSGLISGLKTWNDVKKEKSQAALNPVYFLWKARQK